MEIMQKDIKVGMVVRFKSGGMMIQGKVELINHYKDFSSMKIAGCTSFSSDPCAIAELIAQD